MKGIPLDFNPGEKFAYSNFGYIIFGRVIERLSGMRYEEYVRARVSKPVGANRTQQGKSHMSEALPEEVKYYWPGAGVNFAAGAIRFPGRRPGAPRTTGASTSKRGTQTAAGSRRPLISCDSWAASMAAPVARTSSALNSSRR